jgi:hypothetical protein
MKRGKTIKDIQRRGDIVAVDLTWRSSLFGWLIYLVQKRMGYGKTESRTYHLAQTVTDTGEIEEARPFIIRHSNMNIYEQKHIFRHRKLTSDRRRDKLVRAAATVKAQVRRFLPYDEKLIVALLLKVIGIRVALNGAREVICTEYVYLSHKLAGLEMLENFYPAAIWQMWREGIVDKVEPGIVPRPDVNNNGEEQ